MPFFKRSASKEPDVKVANGKHHHHETVTNGIDDYPIENVSKNPRDAWQNMQNLEDALETIANDHPHRVARSIPKGIYIDSSKVPDKSMEHCLYEREVYDHMLADSMHVCQLLQGNLEECIEKVRQTPSASPDPHNGLPMNGHTKGMNGTVADKHDDVTLRVTFEQNGDLNETQPTEVQNESKSKLPSWLSGAKKRQAVKIKGI